MDSCKERSGEEVMEGWSEGDGGNGGRGDDVMDGCEDGRLGRGDEVMDGCDEGTRRRGDDKTDKGGEDVKTSGPRSGRSMVLC